MLIVRILRYCRNQFLASRMGTAARVFTKRNAASAISRNPEITRPPTLPKFCPQRQDLDAVEQIRAELLQYGCTANNEEILEIALRHMERDLDSGMSDEVVEEVRTELLYLEWSRGNGLAKLMEGNPARQRKAISNSAAANPSALNTAAEPPARHRTL